MNDNSLKKKEIAERVRIARKQAGLTQEQVARILGWKRPTVSQIESSERKLSSEEAVRLAEVYRVDLNWLFAVESVEPVSGIEAAARELKKLKGDDLENVLKLIKSLNSHD